MKILKAIGSFILGKAELIAVLVWLGLFLWASVEFAQDRSLANAVRVIVWALVLFSQLIHMQHLHLRESQENILRQLTKLRHPAAAPKPQVFVIRKDKLDAELAKMSTEPIKFFSEPKNRDDINAGLKQQFGSWEPGTHFPTGAPLSRGGVIKLPTAVSTDPRMTAKVTGEFPLTDDEWRDKIDSAKAGEPDWTKISNSERKWLEENEPAFKETRDSEVEQDRTIADLPADASALTDEQWTKIEASDIGPNPQPEEMREPFSWHVPGADYSPDSPHYGKPHEDCCK